MKTIVHLSDLHFGKIVKSRVKTILAKIHEINPDIIVISGDFTQRATEAEFIEAKKFVDLLPKQALVVPGNHDIPLYNVFKRLVNPFANYKKYICDDLSPMYVDKDVALFGINSVRRYTVTSGKISNDQIRYIEDKVQTLKEHMLKIVVTHHPFDLPTRKNTHHKHTHKVIGRSRTAMEKLAKVGIDIFLSGHLHLHHIGDTTMRYKIEGYNGLIVQAGTAISKRSRGEPVSFNVLRIDKPHLTVEHYSGFHRGANFNLLASEHYVHTKKGWQKEQ